MDVVWTPEQEKAIYKNRTNIIVSAGAGSGKTAVLTERIKQKLLSGVKLEQLLVLTFSNAAAHEMKDRIKKAVIKEPKIADLAKDIDSAYITTFDSYALSLVKKYSYKLNLDSDLSIVEQSILDIEKRRIIDEIMEQRYTTLPSDFEKLATNFFIKDDKTFKEEILKISNKLDLRYDKLEYLNNYINNYFLNPNHINKAIDDFVNYIFNLIASFQYVLEEEIYDLVDQKTVDNCVDLYSPLFNAVQYDDVVTYMNSFSKHIIFKGEDESLKEKVNDFKKNYFDVIKKITNKYSSIDDIKNSILDTKTYTTAVISIIKELEENISKFKFNHSLFDFCDIAKLALKILIENEDIRLDMKNQLNEILVDEYQDTSDLQEHFISLIENNNVYMVGDIKQSIYRFRNANPAIFKNKYDLYKENENKGIKIDLTNNFRSRNEVVTTINHMFNQIMNDDLGGANYQKEHQMIYGNKLYENKKANQSYDSEVLTYEYDKELGMSKSELEIRIIANDILNKLKNNYQVVDKDSKELRKATFKDFCILASGSDSFSLIKDIFKEYGIETLIHKNEKINANILIFILKNLLTLAIKHYSKVYDSEFNLAFVSIARSFLCEYIDEKLFDIVTNKTYIESDIISLINNCITSLPYCSTSELLKKLLNEFNFYEKMLKVDDNNMNIVRLEYFLSLCDKIDQLNLPMDEYPIYLELLFNNNNCPEIAASMKEVDAVIIMTIHKSKGLEFPIVYLPFLYKNFNLTDLKDRFIYDNSYGIITPYFNEGIDTTIYKDLLVKEYKKNEISEKIRLFYVALTRAKENLIFIHPKNEKQRKISPNNIKSFDDLLLMIDNSLNKYVKDINMDTLNQNVIKEQTTRVKNCTVNKEYLVKDTRLFATPIEQMKASKTNDNLINYNTYKNMQLGIHIHEILEYIDYDNPDVMLENEETWIKEKVKRFLSLFIFDKKEENNYFREYAFTYKKEESLINGIIDLLVETPSQIFIIDYKMKNINDDAYINQLKVYKDYISSKTTKPISVYLYSFIEESLKQISISKVSQ